MKPFFCKLALLALYTAPLIAQAQEYPNRPITLIVPWNAGSNTDVVMRAVADAASKKLGQPFVIDNKPGVTGTLGPGIMALNAKPDGYTIAQVSVPLVRQPFLQKTRWDPIKDFTYISNLMGYTMGVVAGAQTPFKSWNDVVAFARTHPDEVSYASSGQYGTPHLAMEQISALAKVRFNHVPFKGGPEANTAVAGGHTQLQANSANWKPLLDSGKARLLVVWSQQRSKQWPEVPTLKELGYPLIFESPLGIAGPKGMDPKIVTKLDVAFRAAMDTPEVKRVMDDFAMFPNYKGPEEYRQFMVEQQKQEKRQLEKMGIPIVK
ncbi:tripartite tricarboxylate transporter substrate binding protein [Cupriavidus consociatus]|uniref:tripartite tricarboxylate transporter substrate binding protein n=1 Tax=Cupriavidus consociatus TaxID=2821357 RepID=UPI001AEA4AFD|nr:MULTISPECIES: tripartite tricarboxylate transporter substrate binding protein [unclassified Cupriavidus]MBP0623385.1 tripartite tricarboxylate transporter substrate binding protein [Cupriavidus sp. LEh25]MDK2660083.1 tripartite tricarboxylate transporter substrate binding protein [Cupriavidus sp. LEh21]